MVLSNQQNRIVTENNAKTNIGNNILKEGKRETATENGNDNNNRKDKKIKKKTKRKCEQIKAPKYQFRMVVYTQMANKKFNEIYMGTQKILTQ